IAALDRDLRTWTVAEPLIARRVILGDTGQTHDGTRKIWHKFDRQSSIGYHLRLRFPRSHADSGQDSIRAPSGDGPKHNRYVITDWSSKTRGVRPFLEGLSSTRRQGDTYSGRSARNCAIAVSCTARKNP